MAGRIRPGGRSRRLYRVHRWIRRRGAGRARQGAAADVYSWSGRRCHARFTDGGGHPARPTSEGAPSGLLRPSGAALSARIKDDGGRCAGDAVSHGGGNVAPTLHRAPYLIAIRGRGATERGSPTRPRCVDATDDAPRTCAVQPLVPSRHRHAAAAPAGSAATRRGVPPPGGECRHPAGSAATRRECRHPAGSAATRRECRHPAGESAPTRRGGRPCRHPAGAGQHETGRGLRSRYGGVRSGEGAPDPG